MSPTTPSSPPRENLLLNLVCNIAVPTLILIKFSSEKWLGPIPGLLVALAFPLCYGIWDFARRRKTNLFSIIGFFSVLLSGGLGVLKVQGVWFAIKDAAIPVVIGLSVLLSTKSKRPLVRTVLLNDEIVNVQRVEQALDERGTRSDFDRLLNRASYALAASFLLVAVLHFGLVRAILRSDPATPAFNAELGRVHLLALPIVALPSMIALTAILWWVVKRLEALTGLDGDHLFHADKKEKAAAGNDQGSPN
ncbi:MFS transporter [Opitutaceae bacterium EW11]|nr:MFS transporter [Opitutaceae bacterium EW11]